jgi:mono/diheme cytochrome c family protein
MRVNALLLSVVVASLCAACGSSVSQGSPAEFARQVTEWTWAGQATKVYANLYPAQRSAVTSTAYARCVGAAPRVLKLEGFDVEGARLMGVSVAVAPKRVAIPGTHLTVLAIVVHGQLSLVQKGQPALMLNRRYSVNLARVHGRWRYIDPICVGVPSEILGGELLAKVPAWARVEGFTRNAEALAGAKIFVYSGCLNCHTYNGAGSRNLGAPDLTSEGAENKGVSFQVAHLKCPSCLSSGSPMPSFQGLGTANLKKLALFLEASRGQHG